MSSLAWAVVVARVGNGAKSRLSPVLDASQRHELALAMLADVLSVCTAYPRFTGVLAVVDDAAAAFVARSPGAVVLPDDATDMNRAVALGVSAATDRRAETVLVLPGDLPLVSASDFDALLSAADGDRTIVVGASRDGQGTNALLLRPPDVILPAFGPPSVARHVRLALAAGASPRVVHDLGLSVDVDTPRDLAMLADLPVGSHTAHWLAVNEIAEGLASAT